MVVKFLSLQRNVIGMYYLEMETEACYNELEEWRTNKTAFYNLYKSSYLTARSVPLMNEIRVKNRVSLIFNSIFSTLQCLCHFCFSNLDWNDIPALYFWVGDFLYDIIDWNWNYFLLIAHTFFHIAVFRHHRNKFSLIFCNQNVIIVHHFNEVIVVQHRPCWAPWRRVSEKYWYGRNSLHSLIETKQFHYDRQSFSIVPQRCNGRGKQVFVRIQNSFST